MMGENTTTQNNTSSSPRRDDAISATLLAVASSFAVGVFVGCVVRPLLFRGRPICQNANDDDEQSSTKQEITTSCSHSSTNSTLSGSSPTVREMTTRTEAAMTSKVENHVATLKYSATHHLPCSADASTNTDDSESNMKEITGSTTHTTNTTSSAGSSRGKSIVLVVQRFRYGRFLLHNNRKVTHQGAIIETEISLEGESIDQHHKIVRIGSTECDMDPASFKVVTKQGEASNAPSPGGLIAYVSFSKTATCKKVEQAAMTLLNLPVMTKGLWGDGSKTQSILQLAYELYYQKLQQGGEVLINKSEEQQQLKGQGDNCVTLVLIPQANLISKVCRARQLLIVGT
jgi:hypothetical protein